MQRESALRRRVAARLETGTFPRSPISHHFSRFSLGHAIADAWAARARLEAPLVWDVAANGGAIVVTVGGATLGGSGKTRLALSVVAAFADRETIICLLGHAYKSSPGVARVVRVTDDPRVVGDEALACARSLAGQANARVVVGKTRQAALDFALHDLGAQVVVVDGVVQTSPRRADLALLAVGASELDDPGAACPPLGDRRASLDRLLAATDLVVSVPLATASVGWNRAKATDFVRVGLITALARPERIEACLAGIGILPKIHFALGDHARATALDRARLRALARRHRIDAWIATDKCRSALPVDALVSLGAPVFTLVPKIAPLSPSVRDALTQAVARASERARGPASGPAPQPTTQADLDRPRNGWAS